jgi:pimeloyl-ACP methyl ester carboxylesterase
MPRLILFPGLGADQRLYEPQRRLPFPIEVPPLPDPLAGETLAAYAGRLARAISIYDGERVYLGGVSFGALLALEASRHLTGVRGVFLLGGCRDYRAIAPPLRALCQAARFIPPAVISILVPFFPIVLDAIEELTESQRDLYDRMVRETPPERIRWGASAMVGWRMDFPSATPVIAIHGQLDTVIPLRNVRADHVIPRGRHLITLSHWRAVNRFITRHVAL